MTPDDALTTYLYRRLGIVEARVRAAVARRRAVDPNADDRFRGLYIAHEHVDHLLSPRSRTGPPPPDPDTAALADEAEAEADEAEANGTDLRLRRLQRPFRLHGFDVLPLLLPLSPALDP